MAHVVVTDRGGLEFSHAIGYLADAGHEVTVLDTEDASAILALEHPVDALIISFCHIGRDVMERFPELNVIATTTVGYDSVDIAAAADNGVVVYNLPSVASEEVATHALAGMLALVRGLREAHTEVARGGWDYRVIPTPLRLSEARLGVVGMGRIARKFVDRAAPLFGQIVGYDPYLPDTSWPDAAERASSIDDVFRGADVVSVHVPLTPETSHVVNRHTLGLMNSGGYLINVSRGGLVDQQAVLSLLDDGQLRGAFLDVLDPEPPDPFDPVLQHPKILLSPHSGFFSQSTIFEYEMIPARVIRGVLAGESVPGAVRAR